MKHREQECKETSVDPRFFSYEFLRFAKELTEGNYFCPKIHLAENWSRRKTYLPDF